MMYLHEEKEMFAEAIQKTREETGIEPAIVEKDYYVSMMLSLLASSGIDFVFKGVINYKRFLIQSYERQPMAA